MRLELAPPLHALILDAFATGIANLAPSTIVIYVPIVNAQPAPITMLARAQLVQLDNQHKPLEHVLAMQGTLVQVMT